MWDCRCTPKHQATITVDEMRLDEARAYRQGFSSSMIHLPQSPTLAFRQLHPRYWWNGVTDSGTSAQLEPCRPQLGTSLRASDLSRTFSSRDPNALMATVLEYPALELCVTKR